MKKPRPGLILSVTLPFLTGCIHTQVQPLPAPDARSATEIRGVVLNSSGVEERIEFEQVESVEWTDSTVVLTGVLKPSTENDATRSRTVTMRSFPLAAVSGVLVRQVDVNRTSIVIAAVAVGAIAVTTLLLTGKTDEGTVLGVTHRD